MIIHYSDHNDNEVLAEIDGAKYLGLLTAYDGEDLAEKVSEALTITEWDPRKSEFDAADAFFPYIDVHRGFTTAEELLEELN